MRNKKLLKRLPVLILSAAMILAAGNVVYAGTKALPNGTVVNQDGQYYLTDADGERYSGWFIDEKEDWYYFNETDQAMKRGWHHDGEDGYWYYLSQSDGKMATGWQTIDGREYFFQPVREAGNYHFNNEQEKWLYSINNKVPYGAMYVNTTTPDGKTVGADGSVVNNGSSNNGDSAKKETAEEKKGWVSENGKWYYYSDGNKVNRQWLDINGTWYYMTADGSMASDGWEEIGGKSYYFGSDGALYVNTVTPDGTTVDGNGAAKSGGDRLTEEINYADLMEGQFVEHNESYQWWAENQDKYKNKTVPEITNDPNVPDLDWSIFSIGKEYFNFEIGKGPWVKSGVAGTIIEWTSYDSARLIDDFGNTSILKVLDENTIDIDGTIYVRDTGVKVPTES